MLYNPPWMWHEIHNGDGFNIGVATRENRPVWMMRNNWLFSCLFELSSTARMATQFAIPKEKKFLRFVASVPFLPLGLSYVVELLRGPQKNPLFTAVFNPCDEHDPNGCTSTILDKLIFSDHENATPIPYQE